MHAGPRSGAWSKARSGRRWRPLGGGLSVAECGFIRPSNRKSRRCLTPVLAGRAHSAQFMDRIELKFGRKMATAQHRPGGLELGRATERSVHLA